jgi:CheY-like chemotaxis protein
MDEIEELLQQSGDVMPARDEKSLGRAQDTDGTQTEAAPVAELMPHQTIDINVPVMENSASTPPTKPAIAYDTLRGLKVLIVEDMPSNQEVIKLFLEPEGCEMLCAANGLEALDILGAQAVDIILMDIRMPAMDGIEAMRAIRSQQGTNQHVPIIALTADVAAENNAECMAAGADIFLTKPVMCKDLIAAIRFLRHLGHDDDLYEEGMKTETTQTA